MRPSLALFATFAALAVGCVLPLQIRSTDLAARATASPIAAQRDLADRRVVVDGVVSQTSLTSRTTVVATGGPYTAVAEERREQLALAVLEPGTVLCYFEPEGIDVAAEIKEGQRVRLDCRVDSIRVEHGRVLTVLAGCTRP